MGVLEKIYEDVTTYVSEITGELKDAGGELRTAAETYAAAQQGYTVGVAEEDEDTDATIDLDMGIDGNVAVPLAYRAQTEDDQSYSGPDDADQTGENEESSEPVSIDIDSSGEHVRYTTEPTETDDEYETGVSHDTASTKVDDETTYQDEWTITTEHAPDGVEADTVGAGESLMTYLERAYGDDDGPTSTAPSQEYVEGLVEKGYENGVIDEEKRDTLLDDVETIYRGDIDEQTKDELVQGLDTIVSYAKDQRGS